MAGTGGGWKAMIALAAVASASAAQAERGCWRDAEASAARVRQMQTMLMVATLRCRAAHVDIAADYNGFVTARGAVLATANEAIKRHFAQEREPGPGGAQADYDRFATSLANGFGDDDTTEASCAEAAMLAHDGAAAADGAGLQAVAARLFPVALPGGLCAAPRAPESGPPPIIALAAPEEARPVALAADVVAALTVMARMQDAANAPAVTPTLMQVASVAR